MTKIELSKEEAVALLQLIDLAVKSGGLQVAEPAHILAKKISVAAQDKPDISPKE